MAAHPVGEVISVRVGSGQFDDQCNAFWYALVADPLQYWRVVGNSTLTEKSGERHKILEPYLPVAI